MVEEIPCKWPKEVIPDEDLLYMRVHLALLKKEKPLLIPPGIFREHKGSMSADWNKYSTQEQTRKRAMVPAQNGVVGFNVGNCRKIPSVTIDHSPKNDNRAHTSVTGVKTNEEIRVKLALITEWKLNPF